MVARFNPWKRELRLAHALRSVSLLRDVPAGDLLALWRRLNEIAVPAGTVLCRRGEPGDRLFLIQSGAANVQLGLEPDSVILRRLVSGDVVGEMALLTGQPRSADVVVVEDARLWVLERNHFEAVVGASIPLLRALNRALCDLVVRTTAMVEQRAGAQQSGVPSLRFGQYRALEQIGAGGMSVVYHAVHQATGQPAAIKVLPESWGAASEFMERLRREARALQRIEHPNIIRILEVGDWAASHGSSIYLAMEWLPDALDRLLWSRYPEPLPAADALRIAHHVAQGLDVVHRIGLVHRDIKPSNILLREDGTPVLIDFGLVATTAGATSDRRLTASNVIVGTADYIAPEQVAGLQLDGRTDLYALGVTLYEMLAGYVPFAGREPMATLQAHIDEAPPPLPDHVPAPIRAIVEQVLRKRPAERFASAGAMAEALAVAMQAV